MKIIIHWVVSALAIMVTAYLLPGVNISGFFTALVLAVVLGAINAILRPILIVLTLPISIMTLGLFVLVINTVLVLLASYIVPGFALSSLWSAFLFGVVLSLVSWVLKRFDTSD